MKKIILIVAFSLLAASQVFAASNSASVTMALTSGVQGGTLYGAKTSADATTATPPVITAGTFLIGKTSTGVGLGMLTGTVGYAMITQHKSGNRGFGTSYDSTAVYYKDRTAAEIGTPVLASAPDKSDSTLFGSGWTSM